MNILDETYEKAAESAFELIRKHQTFSLQNKELQKGDSIMNSAKTILKLQVEQGLESTIQSSLQEYIDSEKIITDIKTIYAFVRKGFEIMREKSTCGIDDFSVPAYLFIFQSDFRNSSTKNKNYKEVIDQLARSYYLFSLIQFTKFQVLYSVVDYADDQARTVSKLKAQSYLIDAQLSVGLGSDLLTDERYMKGFALTFADHVMQEHRPAINAGIGKKAANEEKSKNAKLKWSPLVLEVDKRLSNMGNPKRKISEVCQHVSNKNPGTTREH